MLIKVVTLAIFTMVLPLVGNAQTWTSPDGFLSITTPNAKDFQAVPTPPPPFLALWVSNDQRMKFGVMKLQIPPNVKLIQSSAEEGLAEEIGGKVTRLPTKQLSGHDVWNMTAKSASAEITQAMVRHDGALYKLMAATVGGDSDQVAVSQFIDSLAIQQPSSMVSEPMTQLGNQPANDVGETVDMHNLSKTIGGASALLIAGLLVYLLIRGKKNPST
ncbi:MAG: hypothetical protein MUD03_02675 [Pirellula sp.]|jgi:hypothetical protein|nr:hypothetical protein [Pirellula sp.]